MTTLRSTIVWPLLVALLSGGSAIAQEVPPSVIKEARQLQGLNASGEIVIDRAGIPHIYASTARDGFFLQGYAVARDRLWQIDLWRKRGLGRLSASFGPSYVKQDRASRLLLYRGDMAAEWRAYPPSAKDWTEGFVGGINAYINQIEAGQQPLPIEFVATRSKPERWQADDIVRIRSNALASNLSAEVARAKALCGGDVKYEPLRRKLEPSRPVKIPDGLDVCSIPSNVLADFTLGTSDVRFDGTSIVLAEQPSESLEGSNNWVIGARRSTTGRPIMANDPHRAQSIPNLRYLSHIDTPELKIAGAGEPALPGISFGHNGEIAWALTIFAIDQQDLVVNPAATPLREVREMIDVKGEAAREVILKFSDDGPILYEDPQTGRSFALRATWNQPGGSAYFNAAWAYKARTWSDFLVARNKWGAPPLNLLFANRQGDIGWAPGGFVPRRAAGDGLLPVPAGQQYRWNGLLAPNLMPTLRNPANGWIATANQMNVPSSNPHLFALEWTDPSRYSRIAEVIGSKPKFSMTDSMALQNDVTSPLAKRTIALLQGLQGLDDTQKSALRLLTDWDGVIGAESAPAALYEIWSGRHLAVSAVNTLVPEPMRANFGTPAASSVVAVLEDGDLLGADKAAARSSILLSSLGAAWAEAVSSMGSDPAKWRWGTLHVADFRPALPIPGRDAQRRVGPFPLGGSGSTPNALSWSGDYKLASGPSVRLVMDVGAWDNSVVINSPGQSGDPASPPLS